MTYLCLSESEQTNPPQLRHDEGVHHESSSASRVILGDRSSHLSLLSLRERHHHLQGCDSQLVLAMRWLRADLEPCPFVASAAELASMSPCIGQTLTADLQELVAALDRRVPRIDREGEGAIARDSAALRGEALKRIAQLNCLVCASIKAHTDDLPLS